MIIKNDLDSTDSIFVESNLWYKNINESMISMKIWCLIIYPSFSFYLTYEDANINKHFLKYPIVNIIATSKNEKNLSLLIVTEKGKFCFGFDSSEELFKMEKYIKINWKFK